MSEGKNHKNKAIVGSVVSAIAAISLIAADYTYGIRDRIQPMTKREAKIANELMIAAERATGEFKNVKVDCNLDIIEQFVLGSGKRGYVVSLPGIRSNVIN